MIRGPIAFRIVLRPVTGDAELVILHEGEATTAELRNLPAIDRTKVLHLMQDGVFYAADIECRTSAGWEHFLPMDIVWPKGYLPWPRTYDFGASHFTTQDVMLVRNPEQLVTSDVPLIYA